MGGKSGAASGPTTLRTTQAPSPSQNDSQDSINAPPSQSQSQMSIQPLAGAAPAPSAHSSINCKHLPNRLTFLRVYYDAIRAIETGNVNGNDIYILYLTNASISGCVRFAVLGDPLCTLACNVSTFPAAGRLTTTRSTTPSLAMLSVPHPKTL